VRFVNKEGGDSCHPLFPVLVVPRGIEPLFTA
jgi:hypothetical protein